MIKEIIMPKLGQTVEEATVEKWHKKEGDKVEKGEVLLEVVTDKATLEVESFHKGFLRKILVKEGETVPVLQVIGYVADSMEEKLPEVPKSVSEVEEKESFEPQIPQVKSEE
ncbi:MAG TPA: dihydrolipoyl dehydrogenase, partial [Candidatus Omnitrophica bacterium]|nr:dihydrolipoyl dehydrogenase [Candidatus Omnitrophota bacterium]